ncbi:hypothetical protein B0T22DRAFT_269619 [Podospora appendiculata]|uniref:protein-tyrosine-phosphatase n=1 Tax=Podospora appendiculata TaxID=314037 RepID=A0AAE0X409_9PEZI|nr:hypothetical protein B0T22DRAFT_269619 [Podospora appendiculata]
MQIGTERTTYYTMKTSGGQLPGVAQTQTHSRSSSQSFFNSRPTGTPMSSPRAPYSVGQSQPPKLSPGISRSSAAAVHDMRTPSPNYFGLSVEPSADPRDSSIMPGENWSSPSSSVRSFAAAIPIMQMPLDANPEFEAFRRQVDANRGKAGFSLSTHQFSLASPTANTPLAMTSTPSALQRPRLPRWHTLGGSTSEAPSVRLTGSDGGHSQAKHTSQSSTGARSNSLHDSAYVSADSKRGSGASLNPPFLLNAGRHESPAQMQSPFAAPAPEWGRSDFSLSRVDDRHPRLSLVQGRPDPPSPGPVVPQQRADTVPLKLEPGMPIMINPPQLKDLIEKSQDADVLLLDLRVSPQFAQSRIKGALNLCIPTTLLKRATFNLTKLQQTFQADEDQQKFANWRSASHLVVYDAFSSEKRDAVSSMNMIKKFTNEGFSGTVNILRGGFNAFAQAFPDLIDRTVSGLSANLSLGGGATSNGGARPIIAPVIGGVLLPQSSSVPNAFFTNIRQNQDLVDGVGQMDVAVPEGLDRSSLPRWLREAAESSDRGKKVSEKFLSIELTEQSRMRDAYSVFTPGKSSVEQAKVQLSGIEKGGKNRYKDILPFEHARVRLQGRDESCDYVNASHIKASRSQKRYIASQGPLPATFEDFWSVIWDQDVRVIVMLTAEAEGGQLKCHPYWKGRDFGPIKLRVLSEKKVSLDIDKHRSSSNIPSTQTGPVSDVSEPATGSAQGSFSWNTSQAEVGRRRANTTTNLEAGAPTPAPLGQQQAGGAAETPYVIIRKFALSHAAHPFLPIREVTQLHYPSWPDFGAPAQPSHLLALVELANVMQRASLPVDVPSMSIRRGSDGIVDAPSNPFSQTPRRKGSGVGLSWHDAPESSENARPMLVHCSAGCGRTGTFCTVDSVIDMLKRQRLHAVKKANKRIGVRDRRTALQMDDPVRNKRQALGRDSDGDTAMGEQGDNVDPLAAFEKAFFALPPESAPQSGDEGSVTSDENGIDTSWLDDDSIDLIARTVEDFRTQRLSMVQSLRQFSLCYETVIEWVWRLQEPGGGAGGKGRGRSGSLAF